MPYLPSICIGATPTVAYNEFVYHSYTTHATGSEAIGPPDLCTKGGGGRRPGARASAHRISPIRPPRAVEAPTEGIRGQRASEHVCAVWDRLLASDPEPVVPKPSITRGLPGKGVPHPVAAAAAAALAVTPAAATEGPSDSPAARPAADLS